MLLRWSSLAGQDFSKFLCWARTVDATKVAEK